LTDLFVACDQGRKILSTFRGTNGPDGYASIIAPSGDYEEAFNYQDPFDPAVLETQRDIAREFHKLSEQTNSPLEKERLDYFSGFVGMMDPYADAHNLAHTLGDILAAASQLRTEEKEVQARTKVYEEGVPLWLKIAPLVRETMLAFQRVLATRNDLGQLVSMQNKFVRIALEKLRLAILEFLGEPPDSMEQAYAAAITPDESAPSRIFAPTRPSLILANS
jgi:hypothetical protein